MPDDEKTPASDLGANQDATAGQEPAGEVGSDVTNPESPAADPTPSPAAVVPTPAAVSPAPLPVAAPSIEVSELTADRLRAKKKYQVELYCPTPVPIRIGEYFAESAADAETQHRHANGLVGAIAGGVNTVEVT